MTRRGRVVLLLLALAAGSAAHAELRGRRIGEVLDGLRSAGLTFIYNTQIIPADLLVKDEPKAREGIELAREILSQRNLSLSEVAPGVYAIMASPADGEPAAASGPPAEPRQDAGELIVHASRYALAGGSDTSQSFITQQQMQDLPRLVDEPLRVLQRLPGVTTNGFSSLGSVRGGHPNETAIVLDGLRLYEPFHLKNFLQPVSLLDSRIIDGLEFYSGGFPAVFGDRMSGIINATSIRPAQPRYYELGANLFHLSALASSRFAAGRGRFLVSGRRSNIGELARLSENDFGEPNYWDGFGRLDYRFNDGTEGSLHFLVSSDAIDVQRDAGTEDTQATYRNVYAWATLDHRWSDRASSRLIASFTDLSNRRRGQIDSPGERLASVSDDRLFHVAGLRLENDLEASGVRHRFGVEARRLWGRYEYSSALRLEAGFPFPGSPGLTEIRAVAPEPHGYETSGYWDVRREWGARWTVQAGMRVDTQTYDGSGDSEQWSPRVSVMYRLSPQTQLRASRGRFFQAQGINELQVEDGLERFNRAQHADHTILSLEHAFDAGVDLRIEAYRKDYRRVAPRFENLFDPLVLFPEAEPDRVRIAPARGEVRGVETSLRVRPHGAWSGWLSYTWSRAEDEFAAGNVPRSWDQTHAIDLGVAWSRGPWSVTVTNSFHTGWPTTALELAEGAGEPRIVLERRNRRRFAAYDSLDLRVTRTFALRRGALDVFVEASNATSRSNPCCTRYTVTTAPDGALRYSADVDSWLPLVPSAGVLWRY